MSVTYSDVASQDADDRGLGMRQSPEVRHDTEPWPHAAVLSKIAERIPTEAAAYEYLEARRWQGTQVCPHCGFEGSHVYLRPANGTSRRTNRGKLSERRVWKCRECKRQFSVITGTVMHGTHVPIRTWVLVSFEVAAGVEGLSERDVARRYGLSTKSAHFLLRRIRDDLARPEGESLFAAVAGEDAARARMEQTSEHHESLVPGDLSPLAEQRSNPVGTIVMW